MTVRDITTKNEEAELRSLDGYLTFKSRKEAQAAIVDLAVAGHHPLCDAVRIWLPSDPNASPRSGNVWAIRVGVPGSGWRYVRKDGTVR